MTRKFQNRIKRVMYRPAKRSPNMEFIIKRLGEAEDTLLSLLGKNKRRTKK